MAGFGKVTIVGEYFNQRIINVLHYRSVDWLPLAGNPFDDVLAFVDAVWSHIAGPWLFIHTPDYRVRQVEGVGFDDAYNIVTASPLVRELDLPGTGGGSSTNGAAPCGILSLRCGPQFSINSGGFSKRNRGYLAIGPAADGDIDNYSHLSGGFSFNMNSIGSVLDDNLTLLIPPTTLIPIRVHEKFSNVLGIEHLDWRTYSDVLGYKVNAVASYRKSRQPEA